MNAPQGAALNQNQTGLGIPLVNTACFDGFATRPVLR